MAWIMTGRGRLGNSPGPSGLLPRGVGIATPGLAGRSASGRLIPTPVRCRSLRPCSETFGPRHHPPRAISLAPGSRGGGLHPLVHSPAPPPWWCRTFGVALRADMRVGPRGSRGSGRGGGDLPGSEGFGARPRDERGFSAILPRWPGRDLAGASRLGGNRLVGLVAGQGPCRQHETGHVVLEGHAAVEGGGTGPTPGLVRHDDVQRSGRGLGTFQVARDQGWHWLGFKVGKSVFPASDPVVSASLRDPEPDSILSRSWGRLGSVPEVVLWSRIRNLNRRLIDV